MTFELNKAFPINVLFDTAQGPFKYLLKAYFISIVPAVILSLLITLFFPGSKSPDFPEELDKFIINVVILALLMETFLLWFGIAVISKLIKGTIRIALISGLIWAILHSLAVPLWGISIFWSFVVFSISFIQWKNISISHAIGVAAAIHMCQNLTAAFIIIVFS